MPDTSESVALPVKSIINTLTTAEAADEASCAVPFRRLRALSAAGEAEGDPWAAREAPPWSP
eukprot:6669845-Pyramimonas_sp.AAC.1